MDSSKQAAPLARSAAQSQIPAKVPVSTPTIPPQGGFDPVDATGILAGVLVVVVRTDVGRYRRRVFLSLRAAERSARNARARGQVAEIVLCTLQPAGVLG